MSAQHRAGRLERFHVVALALLGASSVGGGACRGGAAAPEPGALVLDLSTDPSAPVPDELRVSVYGLYQYQPNFAIIGRIGVQMEDFSTSKTEGCVGDCLTTFLSAGLLYAPRKYLDLGLSIGFDDLAHGGSFAPAGFLAFRI